MLNRKSYFIILIIFFTPYFKSFAGEVFKARGGQAIVELKGIRVQPGDMLIVNSGNNVRANVRVKKVNAASSFALVDIIEGRVRKGDSVSQTDGRSIASDDELYNDDSESNEDYDAYRAEEEDFIDNDDDNSDNDETDYVDDNRMKRMKRRTEDTVDNTTYAYSKSAQRRRFAVGLFGGLDFDILKLKFPNRYEGLEELSRKNVVASGLGFNANIALDYDFMDMLGVRVFTGWKRFSVKSQDSTKLYSEVRECYDDGDINEQGVERDCELQVNLYGVNVQLQYYIPGGMEMIQPLVGLGVGMYFVINTSKNYAIKEVKTMGSIAGILGVNVIISKNMYLTAQADYNFSLFFFKHSSGSLYRC